MHRKKSLAELTRISEADYHRIEKIPVRVMADNVRSMANVGAIFRTADAFLIREVILTGICGVPPHREITKAALGAEESVDWRYCKDSLEEARRLQSAGVKVCVLEQTHESVELQDFRPAEGEEYLIVVGNEVEGVRQEIADLADVVLEIPQRGVKHSLNVASSASICMWHFFSRLLPGRE